VLKTFRAAVVQMDIEDGNKERNLARIEEHVAKASRSGAIAVCLPEYTTTGFVLGETRGLAEPIPQGQTIRDMGRIAREHDVYIACSLPEMGDGSLYNTAVLVAPNGELAAFQRKMHMFREEREHVQTGTDYNVASTPYGRMGLMVCYDTVFPEVARNLVLRGAEILLVPANWPHPFIPQWELATSARALDNQIWVVAANRIGSCSGYTYFGRSRIIDPYGIAVVSCGPDEEVAVAELDASKAPGFKSIVDFLADRHEKY